MKNVKLTIEYDGTNFSGWQVQAKGEKTIQGSIEKSLEKIFNKKIHLIGSGRTDAGVHALGQVASFKVATSMTAAAIQKAINGTIPKKISIVNAEFVKPTFHANHSVKTKTYRYSILIGSIRRPHQSDYSLYYPHKVNLKKMREEAAFLVGRKDFKSFKAFDLKRKDQSTIRTITNISIKKSKNLIYIEITANGFLFRMVRNIVGTLLEISSGTHFNKTIKTVLKAKNRKQAGATALAHGLCLMNVKY